jgi:F420-non-reducing hydrogenase iron-sulfur subunit
MNAITLDPPAEQQDLTGRIAHGLKGAEPAKTIVALLCSRSAAQAMRAAGPPVTRNLAPVVIPCAGTVDVTHILTAFRDGAGAVLVAGCHTGNCASIYGTVLASERSAAARKVLAEAGFDPERLAYVTVAANSPGDFARAVIGLEGRLGLHEPGEETAWYKAAEVHKLFE